MKVRLYFRQVWDKDGNLHEIKTISIDELSNFMKRNGGSVKGYVLGFRLIPKNKLLHFIDNLSIE